MLDALLSLMGTSVFPVRGGYMVIDKGRTILHSELLSRATPMKLKRKYTSA